MVHIPQSPIGRIVPRRIKALIDEALGDTRVVLVNGPRQSGKSTLVMQAASERNMEWFSLDNARTLAAAHTDPEEFVRQAPTMVIDEIQRCPEILLSIKEVVDRQFVPGRFLLTGSARVLGLRNLPDTLIGRMETITLWPLSQGEIEGTTDEFIDTAFALGPQLRHTSDLTRKDYTDRIVRGGFPEAVAREGRRRRAFFDSYVADLVNRDVIQLSEIQRGPAMRSLIDLLADRSGQLLVSAGLAKALNISRPTIDNYLSLLEEVYLIRRIPYWSRNMSTRAAKSDKVAFVDSGIAAAIIDADARNLQRSDSALGSLLEGFVAMEVERQLSWSTTSARMYHYRTRDKVEVDIVLETPRRQVIGIEVKASATPRAEDFKGLEHLRERLGDDFVAGYLLYTGDQTVSFGPKLRAVPISALWEVQAP